MAGISSSKSIESLHRYVVFDVETTGLSPRKGDRIIEIGAVAIEDKSIAEEFHSLIDAGRTIPKTAQKIHGISDEMLAGEPPPEEVIPLFDKFIRGTLLVAHNAQFDIGFLVHEFGRLGLGLNNKYCCTLEMSKRRYPRFPNYKLETVFRCLFGKSTADMQTHRALSDARMVAQVWLEMVRK